MPHPEYSSQPTIESLFPEAVTAQSVKISTGDEVLEDPTEARRCLILVCSDEKILSELHLNNGEVEPSEFASKTISKLKTLYPAGFSVILAGGDKFISQNYIDAMMSALESDPQIIFDSKNCDVGETWARKITANPAGAIITRKDRSWGQPETITIPFPKSES